MIYFDNAATGGFKPYSVQETVPTVIKHLCANPTRSGHKLARTGGDLIYKTRKLLASFFGAPSIERVIFTKNCTEALNEAIFGLLKEGDHVITTCMEHNSTLRPLFYLKEQGKIDLDIIYPKEVALFPQKPLIRYDDIKEKIKQNTALVITNHVSNVTGDFSDTNQIGNGLKRDFPNIAYLVDGAQSAGHININMQRDGIDLLCLAGHKGLCGIMGSGALIFNENVSPRPLLFGGTGSETFNLNQPECYPESLESGTLNLPAIVALFEGVTHIKNKLEFIGAQLLKMTEHLISCLNKFDKVRVYSNPNPFGIVAFKIENVPSEECAERLSLEYDIAVRAGFHCAPLMHKFLKTEQDGLIRASLSTHNTFKEITFFAHAIQRIIFS